MLGDRVPPYAQARSVGAIPVTRTLRIRTTRRTPRRIGACRQATPIAYLSHEHNSRTAMAYITITTDEGCMTLQEGIAPSEMESEFFCAHLVERLRWAVEDAHAAPSRALPHGDSRD